MTLAVQDESKAYAEWVKSLTGPRTRLNLPEFRFVYFIKAARLQMVKIGVASDPKERMARLQACSPDRLHLLGVMPLTDDALQMEAHFHNRYRRCRAHGEWFKPDKAMWAEMEGLMTVEEATNSTVRLRLKPSDEEPLFEVKMEPGETRDAFLARFVEVATAHGFEMD